MDNSIIEFRSIVPLNNESYLPAKMSHEDGFSYAYTIPAIDNGPISNLFLAVPMDEHSHCVGYELDESVPKADEPDYLLAVGCGLFSGVLSVVWNKMPSLSDLRSNGEETADRVVMGVAKAFGGHPKDMVDAIRFLEQKFPIPSDSLTSVFGGGLQHHLRDFAHHPTPIGMLFSIITQFTGTCYGTDTSGAFIAEKLADTALIGNSFGDKVFRGVVNWFFHLISDMAGSSGTPGKGTGIPGFILSAMKEISSLPLFQNIKVNYKEGQVSFSQLISKLFNGTFFRDANGNPIRFDLRAELGIGEYVLKSTIPVIINECLTRAAFTIRQLYLEIKHNDIRSFADLDKIDLTRIAPWKNRILTRMLTVSSGMFVAANATGAAVKAHGNATKFFLYVNYPGIARFAFACVAGVEYIKDDVRSAYRNYCSNRAKVQQTAYEAQAAMQDSIQYFKLSEEQHHLLLTIERKALAEDIDRTKDTQRKQLKEEWMHQWEEILRDELKRNDPFLDENTDIHQALKDEARSAQSTYWYYILLLEANNFVPYQPFGEDTAEKYKGLKFDYPYIQRDFFKQQTVLPEKRVSSLISTFNGYNDLLNGGPTKRAIQIGATVGAGIIAGFGAFVFAPGIATLLVGGAFTGLHGAALTGASLAMLGGGSLVAGGLGMAGGTAVITGGGALLGLLGSGAVSTVALMQGISSPFVRSECAKQLTVCKYASYGMNSNYKPAVDIMYIMQSRTDEIKSELVMNPTIQQDKKKMLNDCVNIFHTTCAELEKILMS